MMKTGIFNGGQHRPSDLELDLELENQIVEIPELLNLLPMVELNSFPGISTTISVSEESTRETILKSFQGDRLVALFALRSLSVDPSDLRKEDFFAVGVAAEILEVTERDNNYLKVDILGLKRIFLVECLPGEIPQVVTRPTPVEVWDEETLNPLVLEAKKLYADYLSYHQGQPADPQKIERFLEREPAKLADLIMSTLPMKTEKRIEFLLIENIVDRFQKLIEHLNWNLIDQEAAKAIGKRMEESLSRQDRDSRLREQLKAIRVELGEEDELNEILLLEENLKTRQLPLEAKIVAERELKRLKMTPPHTPEYGVIQQFLEWIVDLPWDRSGPVNEDLGLARRILERDHYGLDNVKKRILEFMAVHQLTPNRRGPIMCLTGPPGVGKTSLASSIAEALGRKFVRVSLGGVKDEAEIRGHRRTYVGARPGRVIAAISKCGVNNPVFLLDEVDKMTNSSQGDPAAALLEALDNEQNDTFTDHYLEIPFDLSKVMFILTANLIERVPAALRDRLGVIEVSGYASAEKMAIARDHLWPKELERHGLDSSQLTLSDEVLGQIIDSYTSEAGCRDLCRHLRSLIRSRAVDKAEGRLPETIIRPEELQTILGAPRYAKETMDLAPQVGVATGLVWTPVGGDLMFVEAVAMPGRGHLVLTGQLGEVMRESAQAAISYARSKARDWRLDPEWFKDKDVHIHLPHGTIPKDGPSAGVSLVTALVSLMSGAKIRPDLGLTGEITLRGLVLPVGGVKEKILAAKRAGLTAIAIPERNMPDVAELPSFLTEDLEIVPIKTVEEVLKLALLDWAASVSAPTTLESFLNPSSPTVWPPDQRDRRDQLDQLDQMVSFF